MSRTTWIGLLAGNLTLDSIEKADEFDVAVALHAAADHGAVEQAERSEQGGGAVPLVVVRHRLAAPRLDRQSGLGAVERLDLALLIKREHHRMVRRIDIEPDDVGEFRGKAGIARRLKVRRRCSCSLCARQMRWTEPCERPQALAIAGPVQWVAWCGGSVQVSATTRAVVFTVIGDLPGLRVLSWSRPATPLSAKRWCHRHTVGRLTRMLCATRCAECRSAEEHNARPLDVLARPVAVAAIAANCSRSAALNTTQTRCAMVPIPLPWLSIAHSHPIMNLLIESEH